MIDDDIKKRDEAVAGTVADIIILISTLTKAHPQVAEAMQSMQGLLAQLTALLLGPEWPDKNSAIIDAAIKERLEALSARVMETVAQQGGQPEGATPASPN